MNIYVNTQFHYAPGDGEVRFIIIYFVSVSTTNRTEMFEMFEIFKCDIYSKGY